MPNTKIKNHSSFREKSHVKHSYKGFYLQYLNELAPEVSTELLKLTPRSIELFGTFPFSISEYTHRDEIGVYFYVPREPIEQRDLLEKFFDVFTKCIWKNSRILESVVTWQDYLHRPINELEDFQNAFEALLEKFCFGKEWLAESAFLAIWNGTGKLQIEASFMEIIPKEVIVDIKKKQGIKVELSDPEIIPSHFWKRGIPPPPSFFYPEPILIDEPFELYEENAVKAYKKHLQNYFKIVRESLKEHGYKLVRGDQYDYKKIQRLVYWNNSDFEYLWEVIQQIPEFEKIDVNDRNQRDQTEDKLRKSFEQFEKYDLPIRPYGDRRN